MADPVIPKTPSLDPFAPFPGPPTPPPRRPPGKVPTPGFKPPTPPGGVPPTIGTPPIFTPPGTIPTPQPFPTPAPVGGVARISIGNIVLRVGGRLSGPLGAILIIKDVLDIERELKRRRQREAKEADARRAAQRAADEQVRVFDFPLPQPEPQAQPEPEPAVVLPPAPQLPEITTPTEIDVLAQPRPTRPAQKPTETPGITEFPVPSLPRVTPRPGILPRIATIGLPASLPFATTPSPKRALQRQVNRAVDRIIGQANPRLTTVQQTRLQSALQPASSTPTRTRTPQQECEIVERRRRRRGKCREGFFREFPGGTQFVTWRTVKCEEQPARTTRRILRRIF